MGMKGTLALTLAATLLPGAASAAPPILNGQDVPDGKWPDAAAITIVNGNQANVFCTGTLIAPTVVLTAGHCEPGVTDVFLDVVAFDGFVTAERRTVTRHVVFPGAGDGAADVALEIFDEPATTPPRALAKGWALADIRDGANVSIVGWGRTDPNASQATTTLREAKIKIRDADCSDLSLGCFPEISPGGELVAGGDGTDTCNGDSGGPLYLRTTYGDFLIGSTEASIDLAPTDPPCGSGGIYARTDAIVDWIEEESGATLTFAGPEPSAEPITLTAGDVGGETTIVANDPTTDAHTFRVTQHMAHGVARVRDDGQLRVCLQAGTTDDEVEVEIADAAIPDRKLTIKVPVHADGSVDGVVGYGDCSLGFDDEASDDPGGCCSTGGGHAGSTALLAGALALVLGRRRR